VRSTVAAGLLGLLLTVGCGEDPPADRPKVEVVSGPVVAKPDATADGAHAGGGFGAVAFKCCGTPTAKGVVATYVALGGALAADDLAESKTRAAALGAALAQATTGPGVSDADRAALEKMAALADRVGGQAELAGAREEFLDLWTPMQAFAKANVGGDMTLSVAFCPMKPGRWLQVKDTIANPYYGSEMLTCGTFEAL
jgi:hypothetical protein